ncbi:hypothetical protein CYMTET_3897 [Cymbomonas tetramitiformis]|uniref:Uncharacterized protein n=1 Tax=Cymbomonas tetramitiformis TaxID=36881 RepID=A0AAE0LL35_9CHLO|nr:hypothetical protein CYMTET_3897 [Cymbomonas tetramitiformis]
MSKVSAIDRIVKTLNAMSMAETENEQMRLVGTQTDAVQAGELTIEEGFEEFVRSAILKEATNLIDKRLIAFGIPAPKLNQADSGDKKNSLFDERVVDVITRHASEMNFLRDARDISEESTPGYFSRSVAILKAIVDKDEEGTIFCNFKENFKHEIEQIIDAKMSRLSQTANTASFE